MPRELTCPLLVAATLTYRFRSCCSHCLLRVAITRCERASLGWEQPVAGRGPHRDPSAGSDAHQRSLTRAGDRPIGDIRRPDLAAVKVPVDREHSHLEEAHWGGHTPTGSPQGE